MREEVHLSPSGLGTWLRCKRRWFYSYQRGLKYDATPAMSFGTSWSCAMDAVWLLAQDARNGGWSSPEDAYEAGMAAFRAAWEKEAPDLSDPKEWRSPEIAERMLAGYLEERWEQLQQVELLGVEDGIAVPYKDLDGALVGRMDKLIRQPDGSVAVVDHKSSSAYSTAHGIQPSWWKQFEVNPQVDAYLIGAAHRVKERISGFCVDAALVHKKENHFEKRTFARNLEQLSEFEREVQGHIKDIHAAKETGDFPRSLTVSCTSQGGCPYVDICLRYPNHQRLPEGIPDGVEGLHINQTSTAERVGLQTGDRA